MVNEFIVKLESCRSFPAYFPKIINSEEMPQSNDGVHPWKQLFDKRVWKHQQSLVKSPAKSCNFTDRKEYNPLCFMVPQFGSCDLYCLKRFWKKYLDVCTCHNSGAKEQSSMGQCIIWNKWGRKDLITLYTLSLVCIFSSLFSIHFFRCCQGEFVLQSTASLVGDHFLYSRDLNVWFRGCTVRRNQMLVSLRGLD